MAGRKKLDSDVKRNVTVSMRANDSELSILDDRRGKMQRGAYLRMLLLGTEPKQVPEVNIECWQELSRSASNINQIAIKLNVNDDVDLDEVREALADFRMKLIS